MEMENKIINVSKQQVVEDKDLIKVKDFRDFCLKSSIFKSKSNFYKIFRELKTIKKGKFCYIEKETIKKINPYLLFSFERYKKSYNEKKYNRKKYISLILPSQSTITVENIKSLLKSANNNFKKIKISLTPDEYNSFKEKAKENKITTKEYIEYSLLTTILIEGGFYGNK